MEKLEKSVTVTKAKPHQMERIIFLLAGALAVSSIGHLAQCADRRSLAFHRDAYQRAEIRAWEQNDLIRMRERSLESQLKEMTETAGAYRSFGVYHDCVQQGLGIYQMEEVSRAYDLHFRSSELQGRCLAESDWYKTHPHGINPAHLNH